MCKKSSKAAKQAAALAQFQIMEQQKHQKEAMAKQSEIAARNEGLQREQMAFQKEQARLAEEAQKRAEALASRPQPLATPESAAQVTGDTTSDAAGVDTRRRGRKGLRIDLGGGATMAGATGINIARG